MKQCLQFRKTFDALKDCPKPLVNCNNKVYRITTNSLLTKVLKVCY